MLGTLFLCSKIWAQQPLNKTRPDGHAPISVMGDHLHAKGGLMFSYRYMPMHMQRVLSSTNEIENTTVFERYMAVPEKMNMRMHMLGLMYAPTHEFTLMLMANFSSNEMLLKSKMNVPFETQSSGFGDVSVSALIRIIKAEHKKIHAHIGVSIPTGSLDQRGNSPMANDMRLAYPMQLGSGTWDPHFGMTYLGQSDTSSWGIQPNFTFRMGTNSEGYSLGNKWNLVSWYSLKLNESISFSGLLKHISIGSIRGKDDALNPMMMPLFDPQNSGRKQWDVGVGSNYMIRSGTLKNMRFAFDVNIPVYQKVEGIQMRNSWAATLGVQYALSHH